MLSRFFYRPYSNTSSYSSFYLQKLGKTAKCSCWLKTLVISDLRVEPPKNCALRVRPAGYRKSRKEAVKITRGKRKAKEVACDYALSRYLCDLFSGGGRYFFPLEPRSEKKNIITPDLRLPGRKKALPNSYSRLLWMQTKSLKRLEVLDFSKGEIPSFLVLLFSF